jgi:hypothetical protein
VASIWTSSAFSRCIFFQLCDLLFEASGLRRARQRRLLPVGAIELVQIARDALLDLCQSPLHLGAREILVPIIDRLELAAVDGDASFGEQAHRAAEHNKPAADLADGPAVVLAEIGDRLVIGNKASRQPHDFHIASGLALKPSARLDPVQIAVNIELQEDRGMIRGSPSRFRIDPAEIQRAEVKLVDKHVNHTNRVILVNPIIQAFGKQRRLPAIHPLDEALHRDLPPKIASQSYQAGRFHTAWTRSRPFRLETEAEDFLGAIGAHAQRDTHSFVANQPSVADLDPQRVEEIQRINCFQRAGLPGGNLLQHRVGDRADQIGRNLEP